MKIGNRNSRKILVYYCRVIDISIELVDGHNKLCCKFYDYRQNYL